MRRRTTRKLVAAASAYIDPTGCDSTVSYKVVHGARLYGSVALSDCSRKIEWYFYNDKDALPKIDKAIEMLQAFRTAFVAGRRRPKRTKRKTA